VYKCQSEDCKSEATCLKLELESLRTQLTLEQSERGKMESEMTQRTEVLTGVRDELKQALDKIRTKDLVISDLSQQMELLQHEVWYSFHCQ